MGKLLLLSFFFATIAIPVRASAHKNPRIGFKRALIGIALFNLFYMFNLYFIQRRVG
jgi:hypothetical protein